MEDKKGYCHKKCCWMGLAGVGDINQNPPMPSFDASAAAIISGAHGTMVCSGTGILLAAVAKWSQSCRTSLTNFVNVICV
jgi:hypothetical protein